jgi:hypothetical protein
LPKVTFGGSKVLESLAQHAEVIERFWELGFEFQCLLIGCAGKLMSPKVCKSQAKIVVKLSVIGSRFDRSVEDAERFFKSFESSQCACPVAFTVRDRRT